MPVAYLGSRALPSCSLNMTLSPDLLLQTGTTVVFWCVLEFKCTASSYICEINVKAAVNEGLRLKKWYFAMEFHGIGVLV